LNSNTRFGELSVGQQRKVQLAKIIAQRANLLILDEPTNHLAPDTLEGLEAALINFQGALVAASHDRWFIDHVATQVWRLTPDGIHVEIR
jgi:ATPase subunit of ABC transporter with duplicated ATPase domains